MEQDPCYEVDIVHRAGKENLHADALLCQPVMPASTDEDSAIEVQIAKVFSAKVPGTLRDLLEQQPTSAVTDINYLILICILTLYYTLSKGE